MEEKYTTTADEVEDEAPVKKTSKEEAEAAGEEGDDDTPVQVKAPAEETSDETGKDEGNESKSNAISNNKKTEFKNKLKFNSNKKIANHKRNTDNGSYNSRTLYSYAKRIHDTTGGITSNVEGIEDVLFDVTKFNSKNCVSVTSAYKTLYDASLLSHIRNDSWLTGTAKLTYIKQILGKYCTRAKNTVTNQNELKQVQDLYNFVKNYEKSDNFSREESLQLFYKYDNDKYKKLLKVERIMEKYESKSS